LFYSTKIEGKYSQIQLFRRKLSILGQTPGSLSKNFTSLNRNPSAHILNIFKVDSNLSYRQIINQYFRYKAAIKSFFFLFAPDAAFLSCFTFSGKTNPLVTALTIF